MLRQRIAADSLVFIEIQSYCNPSSIKKNSLRGLPRGRRQIGRTSLDLVFAIGCSSSLLFFVLVIEIRLDLLRVVVSEHNKWYQSFQVTLGIF